MIDILKFYLKYQIISKDIGQQGCIVTGLQILNRNYGNTKIFLYNCIWNANVVKTYRKANFNFPFSCVDIFVDYVTENFKKSTRLNQMWCGQMLFELPELFTHQLLERKTIIFYDQQNERNY